MCGLLHKINQPHKQPYKELQSNRLIRHVGNNNKQHRFFVGKEKILHGEIV